jgi:GcrA cell cycle regulator
MTIPLPWTQHQIETLKFYWGSLDAREIGERVGGRTKNAVIGKAERLGLERIGTAFTKEHKSKGVLELKIIPLVREPDFAPKGKCGVVFCFHNAQPYRRLCAEHIRERIENFMAREWRERCRL